MYPIDQMKDEWKNDRFTFWADIFFSIWLGVPVLVTIVLAVMENLGYL
jgi:ABC-type sugar transport system permease subunit